jgi:hypothetical protein
MFSPLKLVFVVAVALVVASVNSENSTPEVAVQRIGSNARVRPVRSTLQACRKDFRRLCLKRGENPSGAVVPVSRNSPNECLQNQIENIENEICKTWVTAEQACTSALKNNDSCKKSDIRRCFAKVSASDLPDTCTSSDFYKSFTAMRIRGGFRNRTKSE